MAPWVALIDEVDVVVEFDRTVAVCCIVLLVDTAEDALLILGPPLSGIWAVDVEFDEIGVAELIKEDSKEAASVDCADVGVDDDKVDEPVTGDALLKLESLPGGVWVVGIEFSENEVAELLEEDFERMTCTEKDCAGVEVDDDKIDEPAT